MKSSKKSLEKEKIKKVSKEIYNIRNFFTIFDHVVMQEKQNRVYQYLNKDSLLYSR